MRRAASLVGSWCLVLACALTAPAFAAQAAPDARDAIDQLAGRLVAAVHFDVEGRRSDTPDLFALIEMQAGRPLDLGALRASVLQLSSAGRFDDIRVRAVAPGPAAGPGAGVELVFDLVPRHVIDRLMFAGLSGVPPGDLERDLRQRFNGVPRNSQVDAAARAVERTLADLGYRQAKVRPTVVMHHDPDRGTLLLTVDMGPLSLVTSARVEGASPLGANEVLKRAGVAVGQPYRSRAIDLGLDAIMEELRARGYYEATVSHTRDVVSPDGRSVDVVITVESAALVTLRFAGDPLPGKDSELVPIRREGSADDDLLEDSVRRIELALRREGYWKGHAAYERTDTPGGKLITVTVTRGPRYRLERIDISGNTQMTTASIEAMIGLEPAGLFDESKVASGVAALRAAYLQQGYGAATITATAEALPPAGAGGDPRVVEHLVIQEGVQTRVAEVNVTGASHVTPAEILGAMRLKRGAPYIAGLVATDREAIRQKYDDRGYSAAVVEVRSRLSDDRTRATIQVDIVAEGPQTLLDHVIIVGNRRVSEQTIRNVVALTPGQPLGAAERQALQQRLSAMGLFRRVSITEAPDPGGGTGSDLIITVDESPTTTIAYGGGLEAGLRARSIANVDGTIGKVDKFEVAPRASFEIGRTNLWGKNRAVNLFSGVSLRPIDDANNPARDGKCCGFSEYRVIGSLREPRLFGWNASGLVSVSVEQAIRNSFNFLRSTGGLQMLRRLQGHTSLIAGYSLERVRLYNVQIAAKDQLLVDRLFPQVRLSMLSGSVLRDTRNDPISPGDGTLLSADANLAMRAAGSQVGLAKVFLQGFAYRRMTSAPRVVLAGGARVGLVRGFAQTLNGEVVELVPASQRFFTGGSTTVRGFQQDRLGTPDILDANGLSKGGNGLMVFNAEIRAALTRDLGLATFLDAGNVFPRVSAMHFGDLRASMGGGIRYRSPIGPLRFDVGWKLGGLRVTDSRRWEIHFSIGEAF